MKIIAFLIFPEEDDFFVEMGDNPKDYLELLKDFSHIKDQLKLHKDFEFVYDARNVSNFIKKANQITDGKYLGKFDSQLRHLFPSNNRNIEVNTLFSKPDKVYALWRFDSLYNRADAIYSEAAEAQVRNLEEEKVILINLDNSFIREHIHVIIDGLHYNNLPVLVSLAHVNNEIDFIRWYKHLQSGLFYLHDRSKFISTKYKWQKQRICQEIKTKNYWYYDFYHRNNKQHFEVFDPQGQHIGEASMDGIVDESQRDDNKKIDKLIN